VTVGLTSASSQAHFDFFTTLHPRAYSTTISVEVLFVYHHCMTGGTELKMKQNSNLCLVIYSRGEHLVMLNNDSTFCLCGVLWDAQWNGSLAMNCYYKQDDYK